MTKYKKVNINDFSEFNDKNYKDGIFKLQLNSWSEFHAVVKKFNNYPDYFWRGQESDRFSPSLWSTFDRNIKNNEIRKKEYAKVFGVLKQRLSDVRNIDSFTDNELWAIGQHYGLDTPLLNWTESPYIAAYFAFYKNGDKQNNRVVYALSRALKLLLKREDRFVEFDLSNNNFDHTQNQRLINQKGKFTKALEGEDIKSVVDKFWKATRDKNKYLEEIILAEILIPNKFQDECLSSLQAMNITHGTLFPDYAGAVAICKIDLG